MANDKPSSNLERAAQAAEDFEDKHYKGGELDAQDFKAAGEKATAAVSDAAVAVKEAVVGPADPKVRVVALSWICCRSRQEMAGGHDTCKRCLPVSTTVLLPCVQQILLKPQVAFR